MSANTRSSSSSSSTAASFGMFGVNFVYRNAGPLWLDEYLSLWSPRLQQLQNEVSWVLKRQHRGFLAYWDVMTWLQTMDNQFVAKTKVTDEFVLLQSLMTMLTKRTETYDAELLQDLINLPAIAQVSTVHRWFDPKHPIAAGSAQARADFGRFKATAGGDYQLRMPGLYREFRLAMGTLNGSLQRVPWERLMVLSLLIQIRADLELFYETGHRRLARCSYPDCQAWYIRKPMGQKQQFCSDVCRAMSNRRKAQRRTAATA